MQVFKLYFKILKKYLGSILLYGGIFLVLMTFVILPQESNQDVEKYKRSRSNYAVFDYDDSRLSDAVKSHLRNRHNQVEIAEDEKEVIQDELYNLNVDCVIRLREGFEEAFLGGVAGDYVEIYEVPGEAGATVLKQYLNSYLAVADTYVKAGYPVEQALKKAEEAAEISVDVEMLDEKKEESGMAKGYFKYLAWALICMCVESISVVLLALGKEEVKNRIECSSYPFLRVNIETVLGVLATGLSICLICILWSAILFPKDMFSIKGMLYILNLFCVMTVALAITFLVSKLTQNKHVISLLSNIVGLGMSFLCGVFVPLEILSESVIRIAHFLPLYWYVNAIQKIASFDASKIGVITGCMGIQLMFAAAIFGLGMVVAKQKRGLC